MALKQPCVPKQAFLNLLRLLGYSFAIQSPRIDKYRRPNPLHYIDVPRKDMIPLDHVRSSLRQGGCNEEEIERFIGETATRNAPKKKRR